VPCEVGVCEVVVGEVVVCAVVVGEVVVCAVVVGEVVVCEPELFVPPVVHARTKLDPLELWTVTFSIVGVGL
jgi:hypothetical protein